MAKRYLAQHFGTKWPEPTQQNAWLVQSASNIAILQAYFHAGSCRLKASASESKSASLISQTAAWIWTWSPNKYPSKWWQTTSTKHQRRTETSYLLWVRLR